jgi:predicted RNase H-like nuclease (RuvC/YqgF family)
MCKDCTQNPNAEEYGMTKEEQLQKDLELQAETIGYLRERIAALTEQLSGSLKKIKELEQQIEKMKCCYNCSKWNDGECEESPKSKTFFCADFKCESWECIK